MSDQTIILSIKPIGFEEIKTELTININPNQSVLDLINQINTSYFTGTNLGFLFRGKKLDQAQSLLAQGIKDKTKLMMQRSKEPSSTSSSLTNQAQPIEARIENAKKQLVALGHEESLVSSLIQTLPNYTTLTTDEMVSKSLFFINTVKVEEVSEYSLEFPINTKPITLDESNLSSLFAVGNGTHGQLGIGGYFHINIPSKVRKLRQEKITSIACGINHTVALTENHTIYTWGRYFKPITNNKQESFIGDYPTPQSIDSLSNEIIIKIACGSSHSMAINDKGEMFTWGEGIYGQLGHGIDNNELYPRKLDCPNIRFIDMSGGATHSVALSDHGFLFGWGNHEKNQMCLYNSKYKANKPIMLPIYEYNANYLIDEYNYMYNTTNASLSGAPSIIGNNLIPINEFSTNIEDIMKIKNFACGVWYTAFTSQLFPSLVYVMGNNYKNILTITFFQNNKLDIKQLIPSCHVLYVLTDDNSLYKIPIDNLLGLSSGNEAVKLNYFDSNVPIEKVSVGYNYILYLTKSKQCYYIPLNPKEGESTVSILNKDIKSDIYDICSGPDFYFLLTKLNSCKISQFLFEQIEMYVNNRQLTASHSYNFDLYFRSEHNDSNTCLVIPAHSVIINKFIDLTRLSVSNENQYCLQLTKNQIFLLIEVIYTYNIDICELSYEKRNEILIDINAVESFINEFKGGDIAETLLQLIRSYREKVNEFIAFYALVSEEEMKASYNRHLSRTYWKLILQDTRNEPGDGDKDKGNEKKKEYDDGYINNDQNNEEGNGEEGDNGEDNPNEIDPGFNRPIRPNIPGMIRPVFPGMRPPQRQEKPCSKWPKQEGVVVSTFHENPSSETQNLNIHHYKGYEKQIEYNYQFINRISAVKEKISNEMITYLNDSIPSSLKFTIKSSKSEYTINKEIISLQSDLLNNFINLQHQNMFDVTKAEMNIDEELLKALISFWSYEKKNNQINCSQILHMLTIADYFMADNLIALLETALEDLMNCSNVICLIEIAKDYSLISLHRSALIFLMFNINEVKNKGLIKQMKQFDKKQLEMLLHLNNKSIK